MAPAGLEPDLRDQFFDDLGLLHAGQLLIQPLVAVGELGVVDAQELQHGGVEVADVDGVFDDVVREVIGLAVDGATLLHLVRDLVTL